MDKLLVLSIACLLYALADYVGYNLSRHDARMLRRYRIAQVLMQLVMTGSIWWSASLATACAFNMIWWTFGEDILYYGIAALANPGGRWESRGNFRRNILGNKCTWAYWTPIGILRGMDKKRPISGSALLIQSFLGCLCAIALVLYL